MDSSLKRLSIVIPIYNVEKYLPECLYSLRPILGSSAIRVILVNDGSIDESKSIALSYCETYTNIVLIDKVNGGLSDARNVGMEYVDTEYVFFLDSDDRIDGLQLLDALSFAELNCLDWLQCGYGYDYGDRILLYKTGNESTIMTRSEIMDELVRDGFIKNFAWGKIYRTSIVKNFRFPKGKYFEDSYWQYKIIHNSNRFGVFSRLVTYYRSRTDSISGSFSLRNLDLLEGLRNRLDFIINNYPETAPVAAVRLWELARLYDILSRTSAIKEAYSAALREIKYAYSELIDRGFREQPVLTRLANRLRYDEKGFMCLMVDIVGRILNRLRPSQFDVLTIDKR